MLIMLRSGAACSTEYILLHIPCQIFSINASQSSQLHLNLLNKGAYTSVVLVLQASGEPLQSSFESESTSSRRWIEWIIVCNLIFSLFGVQPQGRCSKWCSSSCWHPFGGNFLQKIFDCFMNKGNLSSVDRPQQLFGCYNIGSLICSSPKPRWL